MGLGARSVDMTCLELGRSSAHGLGGGGVAPPKQPHVAQTTQIHYHYHCYHFHMHVHQMEDSSRTDDPWILYGVVRPPNHHGPRYVYIPHILTQLSGTKKSSAVNRHVVQYNYRHARSLLDAD